MLVVAVKSCLAHLDAGYHDVIRATWGQALRGKALVRFFVGAETDGKTSRIYKSDEVAVDAPDTYGGLPFKTRAICQWATGKRLNHIFLCDTDTYVYADKLMSCGYERYDYVGKISRPLGETFPYDAPDRNGIVEHIGQCHPWASGGYGYFLSQDAASFVAEEFPASWAEDLWVGQLMGQEIVKGSFRALDLPARSYSDHFPSSVFGHAYDLADKWMENMHEEYVRK